MKNGIYITLGLLLFWALFVGLKGLNTGKNQRLPSVDPVPPNVGGVGRPDSTAVEPRLIDRISPSAVENSPKPLDAAKITRLERGTEHAILDWESENYKIIKDKLDGERGITLFIGRPPDELLAAVKQSYEHNFRIAFGGQAFNDHCANEWAKVEAFMNLEMPSRLIKNHPIWRSSTRLHDKDSSYRGRERVEVE